MDTFLEILKALGPIAAVAFIAFYYSDKGAERQGTERKASEERWVAATDRQADKVAEAIREMIKAFKKK